MEPEEFLRRLKRLKAELTDFERSSRKFLRSRPALPGGDLEELTPEADLQGTLGALLADDLEPALAKLGELEGLLKDLRASGS